MLLKNGTIKIKSKEFSIFIYLLIYKGILDIVYIKYISKVWDFMGFFNKHNLYDYITSWILLILISPFIIKNLVNKKASSLFISLFNVISLIPNLTIIGLYNNYDRGYLLSFFVYWFLLNTLNLIIPSIEFCKLRLRYNFIYSMILISSILIILYISYKYTGFRFDLNIFNAYVYRAEADSYQLGNFVDYLFSISRNILPIFIIDKLVKKKRIQALILLIVGLLAYSVTGSKSVLFSYFIVYIGYWFYNDDRIAYIPLWMIFLLIIGLVGIKISGLSYIIDVFIRRVFFIPGLLTYYYYDFFMANPFDYFRGSFIGKLGVKSPYSIPIPQIIGNNYFLGAYANAGLFSDAFSNMGFIGILIMPIILVITLKTIDSVSENLDKKIVFAASITSVFSLINSSYFTVLITHGLLVTIIILYIMNENNYNIHKVYHSNNECI